MMELYGNSESVKRLDEAARHNGDGYAPISRELVAYASAAIGGLHRALRSQAQPPYHKPEHPVDGWGMVGTSFRETYEMMGIPTVKLLGMRTIFLDAHSDRIHRVLEMTSDYDMFKMVPVKISDTTVVELLAEDPTLYPQLLNVAEEAITEFKLVYRLPEPPAPV